MVGSQWRLTEEEDRKAAEEIGYAFMSLVYWKMSEPNVSPASLRVLVRVIGGMKNFVDVEASWAAARLVGMEFELGALVEALQVSKLPVSRALANQDRDSDMV